MGLGIGIGISPILREGVGVPDPVTTFLAGATGFWHGGDVTRFFQAPDGLVAADDAGEVIGLSVDRDSGTAHNATQATVANKPKTQFDGAKPIMRYDGLDDFSLSTLNPAAAFTVIGKLKPGAGNTRVITGAGDNITNCYVGINSSGQFSAGVGSQSFATIHGSVDRRSTLFVGALVIGGGLVKLYEDNIEVYSAAQSGAVPTTVPMAIGGYNIAGALSYFLGGDLYHLIVAQKTATADEVSAMTTYLNSN